LSISEGNTIELGGIHDDAYVNMTGDAMAGPLRITTAFRTNASPLTLRSENSSHPGIVIDGFGDGVDITSPQTGVRATATGGQSAFFGRSTQNSAVAARFHADGLGGQAVVAVATADSNNGVGLSAASFASGGFGIVGRASSETGNAIGIKGDTLSPNGIGILAEVSSRVTDGDSTAFIARHRGSTGTIARFQSGTANVYVIRKSGNATLLGSHFASNHVNTSDERLKEDITEVEDVLPRLDDIRSVRFRFKDQGDGTSDYHLGLLAQEVQAEFPELVEERADGYLGVSYGHMTAVLLQAIKEQQALIESQQTQIDDLLRAFRNLPDSGGSPAVLPASPNGAGER
jgi:hypothetical protein